MVVMQKFYSLQYLRNFSENAFILHRFETKDTVFTYNDILQAVESLLVIFREHGLPKSTGIALALYRGHSPACCVLLLCILNHDCHFCPMEIDLPEHIFAARLYESGTKFLISDKKPLNMEFANNELLLQLNVLGEVFYLISLTGSKTLRIKRNFCYTIGTSGSTGTPKVIHVPYECIAPNVEALSSLLQLSSTDVIYLCAPLTFDPFVIEFFMALSNGASLVITSAAIRTVSLKLLYKLFLERNSSIEHGGGVTILQMTPSLFRVLGVDAIRNVILNKHSSLRVLLLGGEEFPSVDEIRSWMPDECSEHMPFDGKHIYNIYGITELSSWSLIHECTLSSSERNGRIPLGKIMDVETQVRIVNSEGEILYGVVQQGELQLGSTTRKCYIPQIDELNVSAENLVFRSTGDLVERDEKGDIYYIGRLNNTIKRFGKLICLDSLSKKIEAILQAKEVQVICLWHSNSQNLISCLTATNNNSLNAHECSILLKQHLRNYEKPNRILFLKSFPLNAHGKVDRNSLSKSIINSDNHKTPIEVFKRFLSEVLAVNISYNREGNNDSPPTKRQISPLNLSFIAAGGTSFQALCLSSEIGECLEDAAHSRTFLEMLFDPSSAIASIIEFLERAKLKSINDANNLSTMNLKHISKNLNLLWRVNMNKCIDATPTNILNRYICIGSHSHILLTLEAETGGEICRLELPDRIECKVELINSLQLGLVGCYDGILYAFDFLSGQICWQVNVGGMIKAKPLICDEKVIIASYADDFNLLCVCLKTQEVLWRCKIGIKGIFSSPFLLDVSSLLICTLDGSYARINTNTGKAMWVEKCSSPIFSTPALICCNDGQFLIIAEVNGKLHICKMQSGEILHTFEAGGNIFSSITTTTVAHSDNSNAVLIYFGCHDRHVYCLKFTFSAKGIKEHHNTLEQLWKTCLNSTIFAMPVLLHMQTTTYIVACSTKGFLTLLSAEAGKIVAAYDLKAEVFSTPCCIEADKIYFGCRDNFVYCFKVV